MQCQSMFLRSLNDEVVHCQSEAGHTHIHAGYGAQNETVQWTDAQEFKQDERLPFADNRLHDDEPPNDAQLLSGYFPEHGRPVEVEPVAGEDVIGLWDRVLVTDGQITAVSLHDDGDAETGDRVIIPWHAVARITHRPAES